MSSEEHNPGLEGGVEQEISWLTPTEMRTWMAFWGTISVVNATLDRDLRAQCQLGHSDYLILAMLSNAPEHRLRMSELANRVFRSRSRLTYEVIQLERAGLVQRESCPTDKRGAVAVLTREGLHVLRTVAPRHVASIRRIFFDQLTDEQVAKLGEALWAIVCGQGKAAGLASMIERELSRGQSGKE
jgi:DNA-binding MarR family transcriptional regulator